MLCFYTFTFTLPFRRQWTGLPANARAGAGNAALCLAGEAITPAPYSVGSGVEEIVMFLHLAIHVHTAWVLLLTVKLGAVGWTSILTDAMVATLT